MGYHNLSECTLNDDERRAEADRIMEMYGTGALGDVFTDSERRFLDQVGDGIPISTKQLFWLRDIKDKYL
jgi:hypothetical protein